MPTNPQRFQEAREDGWDGPVARFSPRTSANHNHFDGRQAPVKDGDRPGAGPRGCYGAPSRAAKPPVARSRALGIPGVQAADLYAPLTVFLSRRYVGGRNGLLNTMAELFSVTTGEVRIAVGLV